MSFNTYLAHYKAVFVGRTDDYAMQLSNGRYKRVGKPLTDLDLADHLMGVRTYGTYVISPAGTCRFAVIDADTDNGLERLWSIQNQLAEQGIVSYVESSRRGGHLWIFFTEPAAASAVRAWLLPYCPSDFEFYPKQDEGKGYGSLIRLPLGVHRKTGQRYPFLERHHHTARVHALTATHEDRLAWLSSITRMDVPDRGTHQALPKQYPHTSFSPALPSDARGPLSIRQWSAEQDHYQMISGYVSLNEAGVGRCPFGDHHTNGEDSQASFKVYNPGAPGGYCWYCYTWQKGGSVFDFLRYYYGLDAKELWERIQAGSLA